MFNLDKAERDRRWKNIREAMAKRSLDCLVVWGTYGFNRNLAANLVYLANVSATEGYVVFPVENEPTFFQFFGRLDSTWLTDKRAAHPSYSRAISERLRELHLANANIGVVGLSGFFGEMGFPYTTYQSLINSFPDAKFVDATDIIENARRIKSDAEIRCIELGCQAGEKAIQSVISIAKPGVPNREIQATIADTLFRNGCNHGSMLLYFSGKEISHAGQGWDVPGMDQRHLETGDIILTELDARYMGYMAQFNQPFSLGQPGHQWKEMATVAEEAFNSGIKILKPGISVGDLDEAILSPIKNAGYTYRNPPFHGLGLSLEGPAGSTPVIPLSKMYIDLKLAPGMVIEIEPHVVTLDGRKGLTIGCPVLVTEEGCRLLSDTWKPELKII